MHTGRRHGTQAGRHWQIRNTHALIHWERETTTDRERQKETQSATWCANGRLCERLETLRLFILFGSVISVFDFAFYYLLLLMYVCLSVCILCQLSVCRLSESEAKRTAHAGCWWSNAQCCCLIKSRMREFYFALPQSWRCCCCCYLRYERRCCRSRCLLPRRRRRQLSVCVCKSRTQKAPAAASQPMCCRFFRFLLPTPRFPLTNTCTHTLHILFAQFSLTGFLCYKTGRHHQPTNCNKKLAQWRTQVSVCSF